MSNAKIIQLVCLGIFMVGAIFIILAVIVSQRSKQKALRCTSQTRGEVFGFSARGNGVYYPRVRFEVKGQEYESRLTYRNQIVKSSSLYKGTEVEGDPLSTTIRIKRNSHFSTNALQEVFPPGTELRVFYNPQNPKESYVERHAGTVMPLVLVICGGIFFAVGTLFYYILA